MSLTPEQIVRYDEWVSEQPYGIAEPIHAFAAGITQGRAEQKSADAELCRRLSKPHTLAVLKSARLDGTPPAPKRDVPNSTALWLTAHPELRGESICSADPGSLFGPAVDIPRQSWSNALPHIQRHDPSHQRSQMYPGPARQCAGRDSNRNTTLKETSCKLISQQRN